MFQLAFWKAAAERAAAAFSAGMMGALGLGAIDLFSVPWQHAVGVGGGAVVWSLLESLAKARVGPEGPGLTETVVPGADAELRAVLKDGSR